MDAIRAVLTAAGQPVTAWAVPILGANTFDIWVSM